jgi:hypothetical protein
VGNTDESSSFARSQASRSTPYELLLLLSSLLLSEETIKCLLAEDAKNSGSVVALLSAAAADEMSGPTMLGKASRSFFNSLR